MEHYKKKQSRFFEEPCLPNELRISASGKAHDLTTKALHKLKEYPDDGIIISASGSHVTKAVTITELLKRRLPSLEQETNIKYARIEDIWEPDLEGLDTLKVVRRIPAISVHLKSPAGSHDQVLAAIGQSHDTETASTKQPSPRTRTKSAKLKGQPPTGARGRGKGRGKSHDDK